jgi:adenine-specific DNA-methyltransferase
VSGDYQRGPRKKGGKKPPSPRGHPPPPPPTPPGGDDLAARIQRAVDDTGSPRPRRPARDVRPPLRVFTTTHWEYPSQHYDDTLGKSMQGDKEYVGATPSWVIWQLLQRYTRKGDLIVDPMCGSGTTIDVCTDLGRKARGFDLQPTRPEIERADARSLPMDACIADFAFVDPPYSTHVDYSDDEACIGKLDASEAPGRRGEPMGLAYYEAMGRVIGELHRVLKPGRYLGLYVSDSWKKNKGAKGGTLMPIGFELFSIMRERFEPVDIIAVERHNAKLGRGNWHKSAEEGNYFLRGFNYLFIMKKPK